MNRPSRLTDLRGFSRLAVDATIGLADLVEEVHRSVTSVPRLGRKRSEAPPRKRGIAGFVYRVVRFLARGTGAGIERALAGLTPLLDSSAPGTAEEIPSPKREALLSALNGVLGDHLAASGNPLAIPLDFRRDGRALEPAAESGAKIVLLLHGLCMNDRQWRRYGHDHGESLAADLGYTPVYLRYNSGRAIATNGQELALRLQALFDAWPVPVTELAAVAHSMGGLVMRSACVAAEAAGLAWRAKLTKIVFLGTPHHGAPLERGGNWLNLALDATSYTAAFARLARIRSVGITDLRHGQLLSSAAGDDDRFARRNGRAVPPPLPHGVACHAIAASLAPGPERSVRAAAKALAGDGLVPLSSALGDHAEASRALAIPSSRRYVGYGMNHLDLLDRREVYERIRLWLAEPPSGGAG